MRKCCCKKRILAKLGIGALLAFIYRMKKRSRVLNKRNVRKFFRNLKRQYNSF